VCGGTFDSDYFIANFWKSAPVKEFWKSVGIWWSYDRNLVAYATFLTHDVQYRDDEGEDDVWWRSLLDCLTKV